MTLGTLLLLLGGFVVLVVGGELLVRGGSGLGRAFGLSPLLVGLTVVAFAIGNVVGSNVVGSNVFNIGGVMGLTAVVSPGGVPVEAPAVRFDLPVMLAVAVVLVPVVFTGFTIARWEAAVFLGYYAAYVGYLLLAAGDHEALPAFSAVMLFFVVPLTVLTLVVLVAYEVGVHRGRRVRTRAG